MKNWKEYRFGELVQFPPRVELRKGEEYTFIEMDVVNPNSRIVETVQRKKYESSSCSKFSDRDVLMARITPCLENGKIAQVRMDKNESGFGSTEFFVFRAKRELLDQGFLFYLTKCDLIWKSAVNSMVGASGRQRADAAFLKRVRLQIPPPPTQKKIAAILSAYDDLIENNRRRIALLEKMAEEIYREWFVRMRFPGHEQAKFEKGVPVGWEVKRISEVVDFLSGYSFKSETYSSVWRFGVVTIKNVQDGYFVPECTDFVEDVPSNMKKHCYLESGDVLMSLTGNVGRVCHVYGDKLLLNQRVAKLTPKLPNSSQFVFFTFNNKSMIQLIENLSLGSTAQMNLSPILLGKQKMVMPSLELLDRFEDSTLPMLKMKMLLLQQNMLLRKKRDRLLPRLISGKLPVENLDIQFPPSMLSEPSPQPSPGGRGSIEAAHA
jgi:type I restriction enzyme S subunit